MLANWLVKAAIRFQVRKAYAGGFDLDGWRTFMRGLGMFARIPKGIIVEPVDFGSIRAMHFHPGDPVQNCAAVYFHGGLYVGGRPHDYREMVARLSCACNCPIYAVDYRLAPENPFPAAVEDARAAFEYINSIYDRTAVIGDSAGAGLAMTVMRADSGSALPVAGVLLSPMVDLTLSGRSIEERAGRDPLFRRQALESAVYMYLGDHSAKDPDASPLFADLSGYPPLQIHIGTEEMLFDDAKRLAENAQRAGIEAELYEWNSMIHDFQLAARILKEGRESISLIGEFLRRHMSAVD
jgi:monoterpene epsilon-lactone hydrolase